MLTQGAKTMRIKLKKVNEWSKQIRNERPMNEIWIIFKAKLRGHVQYYGVSHNTEKVRHFIHKARRNLYKLLNRRSQRRSFTWEKFRLFEAKNPLPAVKIVHRLF
jgi:RNA-directed DNA polymerase